MGWAAGKQEQSTAFLVVQTDNSELGRKKGEISWTSEPPPPSNLQKLSQATIQGTFYARYSEEPDFQLIPEISGEFGLYWVNRKKIYIQEVRC